MTDHEEVDGVLRRTIDELRTLPPVNEDALARILATAKATPQDEAPVSIGRRIRASGYNVAARWRIPAAVAAGLTLVAAIGGYALRDMQQEPAARVAVADSAPVAGQLPYVPAATSESLVPGEMPVITQFVLDAPNAASVALVGDFNEWDARSTPLARDPQTGLWTIAVPITPGRHVYAFLVNGKQWTLDPRAPREVDADFGRPGSVLLVEGK